MRFITAFLVLCALAACKKGEATDATKFLNSYFVILCEYETCTSQMSAAGAASTCQTQAQASLDTMDSVRSGIEAGRMSFNAATGRRCLAALEPYRASGCWGRDATRIPIEQVLTESCADLFKGNVAEGESCYWASECSRGYCDASVSSCPGRCKVGRREGTACSTSMECDAGLVCFSGWSGKRCAKPLGEGGTCIDAPCDSGLVCRGHVCSQQVALPEGAKCMGDNDCGDSMYCKGVSDKAICAPLEEAGGECRLASHCLGRQLCPYNGSGMQTCQVPSDVGGPCATGSGSSSSGVCFQDLVCDTVAGKCVTPPGPGSQCIGNRCAEGAYCDVSNGLCVAKKAAGEFCRTGECLGLCTASTEGVCFDPASVSMACLSR